MQDVVVVGGGVLGMVTALTLQERGLRVAIWSRELPADTVSAVAAAIWYPFLAEPRERVLGWSAVTFRKLRELARDAASGVRMQRVVEAFAEPVAEPWWASAVGAITHVPAADVPHGYAAAIALDVPVCDTRVHLPWLHARFLANGGSWRTHALTALDEAFAAARRVVNCTGLGARELCGDRELVPVRGQVLVVERPATELDAWIDDTQARPFYVIPRTNDVVLGGSAQHGAADTTPRDDDTRAIQAGLARRWPALAGLPLRQIKVGLRPYRSTVRLQREVHPRGVLVHCYGHGGSGYTLAWGCAAEVAALLAD